MADKNSIRKSDDTAERLFRNPVLTISWVVLLVVFFMYVGWPLRNFFLVCWVYGSDAYFQQGIRVLKGKPVRFSNGELAPAIPDMVTGFGTFFITVLGPTLLLVALARFYQRHFTRD